MDKAEVRLELLKYFFSPGNTIEGNIAGAKMYEEYVLGTSEDSSSEVQVKRPGRPRKQSDNSILD